MCEAVGRDATCPGVRKRWFERLFNADMIATVFLGVGALASSWSSYQATRWGGVQADQYNRASILRIESSRVSTHAGQQRALDLFLFTAWLGAYAESRTTLADFYRQRFRPEFKPAFDEWMSTHPHVNPDAPHSPFVLPSYRIADADQALRLQQQAEGAIQAAQNANQQSDEYVLTGVLFATVMFFAGIAPHAKWRVAIWLLLGMAAVVCASALVMVARFPIE